MPRGTKLTKAEQIMYESWKQSLPKNLQYEGDYDLAGYWKKNKKLNQSPNGHLTDEFKLPNHPTFSDESIYYNPQTKDSAGHWQETDSSFNYVPYNPSIKDTVIEMKKNGGNIKKKTSCKAKDGKKLEPIYVDSKNDPRYRAYQDSLVAYNNDMAFDRGFTAITKNAVDINDIHNKVNLLKHKYPTNSVQPIINYHGNLDNAPTLVDRPDLHFKAKNDQIYKKPVQPVLVGQPETAYGYMSGKYHDNGSPIFQDKMNVSYMGNGLSPQVPNVQQPEMYNVQMPWTPWHEQSQGMPYYDKRTGQVAGYSTGEIDNTKYSYENGGNMKKKTKGCAECGMNIRNIDVIPTVTGYKFAEGGDITSNLWQTQYNPDKIQAEIYAQRDNTQGVIQQNSDMYSGQPMVTTDTLTPNGNGTNPDYQVSPQPMQHQSSINHRSNPFAGKGVGLGDAIGGGLGLLNMLIPNQESKDSRPFHPTIYNGQAYGTGSTAMMEDGGNINFGMEANKKLARLDPSSFLENIKKLADGGNVQTFSLPQGYQIPQNAKVMRYQNDYDAQGNIIGKSPVFQNYSYEDTTQALKHLPQPIAREDYAQQYNNFAPNTNSGQWARNAQAQPPQQIAQLQHIDNRSVYQDPRINFSAPDPQPIAMANTKKKKGSGFPQGIPNIFEDGGELAKDGKWIQKAVNPAHKGYCTPMTKKTCTPKRKAFAKTMKKHHGFHEEGGYVPGQEVDLTPEQMEWMKLQGYEFE